MSTITALGTILLVLMIIVGGKQGWLAFLSLGLNFFYFYLGLILVALRVPPLWITLVMGTIILATIIFMGTEDLKISISAFESAIIVMVIVVVLVLLTEHFIQATGFSLENSNELEGMSILIGISYVKIGEMTMILSCLGAVAELSVALASGLIEICKRNTDVPAHTLMKSGIEMGSHIIGTTLNTLLLGFLGNFLALFIWFIGLNYSFATVMNNKILVTELVTVLISFIGVIIAVPFTTGLVILNSQKRVDNNQENQYYTTND
ncbi:YibE/F family protein [uncultured Limosilactobacillus sp.]|uniref:YibE/F family protein n=1 Tax=uncultured Limosilactobacillus sp. TaxID=2837629 RepID=UPI0025FACB15|nr:YibE/F family protein [uncultured Limosilactobacillus sp.]